MTTIYTNPDHLKTTQDFADRTGQRAQLDEKLNNLSEMCERYHEDLYIHSDFAPMSFYFEVYPAGCSREDYKKRSWNGGLIYHGQLENGTSPETFSVNLTPSNSWSIHT